MACNIEFIESALKELRKIDKTWAKRILDKIQVDLPNNPGKDKELTGDHSGSYSYRIGDYRVIYRIIGEATEAEPVLLILRIGHRKDIYD